VPVFARLGPSFLTSKEGKIMTKKKKKDTKTNMVLPVMRTNAAGIDIGAREIFVAVPQDRATESVRAFPTFTQDLYELANWLKQCGVKTVAMESTGVYWIPLFQILEERGFEVFLVNARHVKNVPGRKTDVSDCQWLQFLHSVGLLKSSFRPEQEICAVRSLLRHRESLVQMASTHVNHIQKALDQMNLQLHHVISDITGQTGLAILDAILQGERNPKVLAKLRNTHIKVSEEIIIKSLVGDYRPEHLFTLQQSLDFYRHYQKMIENCDKEINDYLQKLDPPKDDQDAKPSDKIDDSKPKSKDSILCLELQRAFGVDLTKVPGLAVKTIQTLFGEVGPDFTKFRSASAFASWLALCPMNDISGGKVLYTSTRKVKSRAATALRLAAWSLHRSQSALGNFYRRMRAKLGAPKAITATAHRLARIIFHLVTTQQEYNETHLAEDQLRHEQRQQGKLRAKAKALGFQLVPIQQSA
jgi:transposase